LLSGEKREGRPPLPKGDKAKGRDRLRLRLMLKKRRKRMKSSTGGRGRSNKMEKGEREGMKLEILYWDRERRGEGVQNFLPAY